MCGINGIVSLQITDTHRQAVERMCKAMAHRGPDAEGIWQGEGAVLGHRRLSIIDLSISANQPFQDPSGRYKLVYNGELYNYQSLKEELAPFPFQTASDTEVVLAAIIRWGEAAFARFNGMFALAFWDTQTRSLLLARDRLGIKPLYISYREQHLIFSSELRALLKSDMVSSELRPASLQDFFTYQTVHAPHTLLKEVVQLMPGEYAHWHEGTFSQHSYWHPKAPEAGQSDSKLYIQKRVSTLLTESVEKRMMSDVPLGAFLSGGIDSSAIVGLMARCSERPIHTFSIGFQEKAFDESPFALQIAKKFRTEHQQIRLSPEAMLKDLPEALAAMDNPSGDGINSYLISKYTRKAGLKVALSGLGGDEVFAGYPVFRYWHKLFQYQKWWNVSAFARKAVAGPLGPFIPGNQRNRLQEILRVGRLDLSRVYPIFRKLQLEEELANLLSLPKEVQNMPAYLLNESRTHWQELPELSKISWAEISTYTQNVLLRDADQMSMAHGLEVRVPFFDHELVSYAWGIPDEHKFPYYPKSLLVESLGDLLPKEVVHRKKMGFVFPWKDWMRNELNPFCQHHIDQLLDRNWIKADGLRKQWAAFLAGDDQVIWLQIWLMIVMNAWLEKNDL